MVFATHESHANMIVTKRFYLAGAFERIKLI
jgi:hypothetical protein